MRLALREVLLAFKRAPLLAILGVTTIAFSLFAFGLFGLVAINIKSALLEIEVQLAHADRSRFDRLEEIPMERSAFGQQMAGTAPQRGRQSCRPSRAEPLRGHQLQRARRAPRVRDRARFATAWWIPPKRWWRPVTPSRP
jgi:hypothetical protein